LNPDALAFITCVNDETQYDTCIRHLDALQIPAGHTVETIAVFGAPSMAEGYQRAMEASTARYKIYVHQDVYIVHRELLPKLVTLFRTHSRLGMVGVVGATRLTASGIWWLNNASHSYGRIWEYSRPGGFWSWLGPFNRRRLHLIRYRSFVGDYLPAAVVDGLFLATQYDLPWISPLGGFELYEQVQGLEFIKAGLEIGIARQETVWCLHWGPLLEFSSHQRRHRDLSFHHRVAAFQQHFHTFIGVPARRLNKQDWGTPQLSDQNGPKFCDGVTDRGTMAQDSKSPAAGTERLGVVIVTYNGRDLLLRALRALLPQFEALKDVEYRVVAVDNASTGGTIEAVRGESPRITVLADASNGGAARAFNAGLRELSFPSYVLVMHDDAEFSAGSLAGMVGYLREHPSAAGVVASLMNPDGTVQPQRMAIVELMPQRPQRPRRVTFVGTTCALFRGEVFFDVGLRILTGRSGPNERDTNSCICRRPRRCIIATGGSGEGNPTSPTARSPLFGWSTSMPAAGGRAFSIGCRGSVPGGWFVDGAMTGSCSGRLTRHESRRRACTTGSAKKTGARNSYRSDVGRLFLHRRVLMYWRCFSRADR
jgi:hypothetical protein